MPNPWDVGSAKLLYDARIRGPRDDERGLRLVAREARSAGNPRRARRTRRDVAAATPLPLNIDSERCYPDDPGGVAETVTLLADAGAAGFSIEDFDPGAGTIDDVGVAAERVALAANAAHDRPDPLVLTARAENHLNGVDDLDDTIERLIAYREAGADVVYAPGLRDLDQIARLVSSVGVPVNVLLLATGPTIAELASVGVRRVSTGGALAGSPMERSRRAPASCSQTAPRTTPSGDRA